MTRVAVAGMGLWAPRFASVAAFAARDAAEADRPPSDTLLDRIARRRASGLTRSVADAYKQALEQAGLDATRVASVVGHAIGESALMLGLLEQMHGTGDGALSPMRFSASVHNTTSGVISITTKNTGFTTAIAADFDTPAMALYEGMAIALTHDEPVIVACADEAAPADLVRDEQGWDDLSCALALLPDAHAAPELARLSTPFIGEATLTPPQLGRGLAQNPQVGMLDLIDALVQGRPGRVRLDRGQGRGYCVEITRPT